MFLIDVVPLIKIKQKESQILTYFYPEKIEIGSLVLVPVKHNLTKAVVIAVKEAASFKTEIKKLPYRLKKIEKILKEKPILSREQLKLANFIHNYYYTPLGKAFKLFPYFFSPNSLLPNDKETIRKETPIIKTIAGDNLPQKYLRIIKQSKGDILIISPDKISVNFIFDYLRINLLNNFQLAKKLKIQRYFSNLRKTEKEKIVKSLNDKKDCINVIIGTRSAIFLPFKNLKTIIIDQEENSGHISWDQQPHYSTKILALKLSEISNAELYFASETPTADSYYFSPFKDIKAINLNKILIFENQDHQKLFSTEIYENLKSDIKNKKKKLLILTARKKESLGIICRDCQEIPKCPKCKIRLVVSQKSLVCILCRLLYPIPNLCPSCGSHNIKTFGFGTEKIENELKKFTFALKLKIKRIDADIIKEETIEKVLKDFENNKYDLLITTSVILKPYILKNIDSSYIIELEQFLNSRDFRQRENAIRIIKILAEKSSKVIVQCKNKDNEIVTALKNYPEEFYKSEIAARQNYNLPPFCQLIKITTDERNEIDTEKIIQKIIKILIKNKINREQILGPFDTIQKRAKNKKQKSVIVKFREENNNYLNPNFLLARNEILNFLADNINIEVDPIL